MLALEGKWVGGDLTVSVEGFFSEGAWRHVVMVGKFPTWFCRRGFHRIVGLLP